MNKYGFIVVQNSKPIQTFQSIEEARRFIGKDLYDGVGDIVIFKAVEYYVRKVNYDKVLIDGETVE
jgi:signal peptidase I